MINISKGTKDVLPNESYKWHYIYKIIDKIAKRYNLKEIMTPTFESTELFVRGVGDSSDIVNKEMYTFLDKGERSITLKPEGTAGVVRSFVENGLFNNPLPLKVYYKTPCFRYEKPQAGRLREHHQFGVEMFGSNNVESELEIFMLLNDFYKSFDLNPVFSINYLGCDVCNKAYKENLKAFVSPKLNDFCPDCKVRYEKNVLRMVDCKVPECKALLQGAPTLTSSLCEDCQTKFDRIQQGLDSLGIKYVVDSNLVRGLDYYTGIVFEILNVDKQTGQSALGGGGRYNKLVEELGGKSTPVIGFGIGIERLILFLESRGFDFGCDNNVAVYLASATEDKNSVLKIAQELRNADIGTEIDVMGRGLKAQFKYADKLGCKFVIVVGDEELASREVTVKNMLKGEQLRIKIDKLVEYIKSN